MPLVRRLGHQITYQMPTEPLQSWSLDQLKAEFEITRGARKTDAHRSIAQEIARRDPTSRRATAAI